MMIGLFCMQGAVPDILSKTKDDFFTKIVNIIKEAANICYEGIQDVPGIICPSKPEGSMFVMVTPSTHSLLFTNVSDKFC